MLRNIISLLVNRYTTSFQITQIPFSFVRQRQIHGTFSQVNREQENKNQKTAIENYANILLLTCTMSSLIVEINYFSWAEICIRHFENNFKLLIFAP